MTAVTWIAFSAVFSLVTFIDANVFPRDDVRNANEIELFQMNNT